MTTDGDPVDLTSALEQLWGPRRGPAPAPAPPPPVPESEVAPAAPLASPPAPVVNAGVDTRLAELRAEIDTLRTQLLAALDEHGSRLRDDARERAARQPVEAPPAAVEPNAEPEPDVDVEGEREVEGEPEVDEVAAQVTGLAERFAGLERLVETAMVEGAKRETNLDRGRARLRATIDEVNARVGVLAERFAGLERLVELAVAQRAERPAGAGDASGRLEAAMDGFDAVVAGLDAAVAGLVSGVADRLTDVAADVVRDATLAPLRRELRGAKADIAAVRNAVAELRADVSSLRSMATPPAAKAAKAAKATKPVNRAKPEPAAAATKRAATPAKKTAARAPVTKTALATKATPRRPVDVEPPGGDEPEAVERPARTSGSRRPFRGELTTWEEDESVPEATSGRGTDAAAARDRRRQILAEAARGAAEGGDLDLDGLDEIFTATEPGRGSGEGDAGEGASKRSRFGSRRHRS